MRSRCSYSKDSVRNFEVSSAIRVLVRRLARRKYDKLSFCARRVYGADFEYHSNDERGYQADLGKVLLLCLVLLTDMEVREDSCSKRVPYLELRAVL